MKKDLVPAIQSILEAAEGTDLLPPELIKLLEDRIPEWLKEYERDGTAVMRWNLEHVMIIEQILQDQFGLTEDDLVKLEKSIKQILPHITKFKVEEPRLLKREDYYTIKQNIQRNKELYKAERSNIKIPSKAETKMLGGKK